MSNGIVFQVETDRVLKILTRDIYDSPLALLRENVQNAYDAIRMRFAKHGTLSDGGDIRVSLVGDTITITDNGIGMNEQVLRENFWRAGSSGKHSDAARQAGVVGTFGIGAMANFGVCRKLTVETRAEGSDELLRSTADRDSLRIAEECITFEREPAQRDVGTTLTVILDQASLISVDKARAYLHSYVGLLPVSVVFNGELISKGNIESLLRTGTRSFKSIGQMNVQTAGLFHVRCQVKADSNGQVIVIVDQILMSGKSMEGSLALLQSGGQLMGLRSYFGLAPVPVLGTYQFGGFANLSFLQPTAGREALSRESIEQIGRLINCAEFAASERIAKTEFADHNAAFLQWVVTNSRWDLADLITIRVLPDNKDVPLADVKSYIGKRTAQYYTGSDQHIINTFANEGSCLFQIAQSQTRRRVQLNYLGKLGVKEVPDSVQVTRIYEPSELTSPELSVLLNISSILRDDYLIPDVDVKLVEMSHGVTVLPEKVGDRLVIQLARSSALITPVLEVRAKAYQVFREFMKDFVRVHIYHRIQQYVPSSTKGGVDALRKTLQRNRELYRYEDSELGDLEGVLGEYLSGSTTFDEVVKSVRSGGGWGGGRSGQSQKVSSEQVASLEAVVPGVVDSPVVESQNSTEVLDARPPILREDIATDMKILTTDAQYPQLNEFGTFLGLSDRLMQTEAPFFRNPHTTRIIWGGHRVIYIFTDSTGQLSLYYDIELRDPLEDKTAGGGAFPTTTLVTGKRIFIPIPSELANEFRVETGSREFFVRFDILSNDVDIAQA
ncbi:MAG: ATP-binding protein [Bryobacteraceae bacterium]